MTDDERKQEEALRARLVGFWRRYDEMEARLTRPVSERMLDLGRVSAGMRVLDIAAGRGEPALPAAHRVGPQGWVLATDLREEMLQMARERASQEGLGNIEFRAADAQALDVGERTFDVATVRWGLMYMPAPERALSSIHRALKPGGALVIASWAEPERVPYASLPRRILERYRELPPLPASDQPGVFRHANRAELEAALQRNGFLVDAEEELEIPVVEAPDGHGIVEWVRALGGPLMECLAELPEQQQRAWEADLRAELERSRIGDKVFLGGVTRLTCARARER